jgi:hypothetical protein
VIRGMVQEDDSLIIPNLAITSAGRVAERGLSLRGMGVVRGTDRVRGGFFYFQPYIYKCRKGGRKGSELVRGGCGVRDGVRG